MKSFQTYLKKILLIIYFKFCLVRLLIDISNGYSSVLKCVVKIVVAAIGLEQCFQTILESQEVVINSLLEKGKNNRIT